MKAMGDAFAKGMVLVMSLWDDYEVNMVISAQHTSMTTNILADLRIALVELPLPHRR